MIALIFKKSESLIDFLLLQIKYNFNYNHFLKWDVFYYSSCPQEMLHVLDVTVCIYLLSDYVNNNFFPEMVLGSVTGESSDKRKGKVKNAEHY